MSAPQTNPAFSFEDIIKDYLSHTTKSNPRVGSVVEQRRAWIVKIQLHLLKTLQQAGEARVQEELKSLWDVVLTVAQGIDRNEPSPILFAEGLGSRKLRALSMLPFALGWPADDMHTQPGSAEIDGDEESSYKGLKQSDLSTLLALLKEDWTFHEAALPLLKRGPSETDTALASWLSLNNLLALVYLCVIDNGGEFSDLGENTTALVLALGLEQERPLAARGAPLTQAREPWVQAAAIWMNRCGIAVATQVYRSKEVDEFGDPPNGVPPGSLAVSKGITSPDYTMERWAFWRSAFEQVWDLTVEYEHGLEAETNGRSLAETGLAAKGAIEAMIEAESMCAPDGELADP